jgi:competence protein ComEA
MFLAGNVAIYAASVNPSKVDGVVNVNTATKAQLMKLPYVNEDIATNIINSRNVNGPFNSSKELLNVKGVNKQLLDQIGPYIHFSGPTTIRDVRGAH